MRTGRFIVFVDIIQSKTLLTDTKVQGSTFESLIRGVSAHEYLQGRPRCLRQFARYAQFFNGGNLGHLCRYLSVLWRMLCVDNSLYHPNWALSSYLDKQSLFDANEDLLPAMKKLFL